MDKDAVEVVHLDVSLEAYLLFAAEGAARRGGEGVHPLPAAFQLRPGGDEPKGFVEHVQAWVLRHPWLAIALLFVAVVVVFSVLLWLGPPVPKG